MSKEHKTPSGWKPCNASVRACKYETREVGGTAVLPPPTIVEDAVKEVEARKPNAVKRFFDSLFTPKRKTQPKPEPKIITPLQPVQRDKVVQGEDGRWQVTTLSPGWSTAFVHKFGDLITDKSIAERLHKADPKQLYQLGDCGVLAGELWNLNDNVEEYYIMQTDDDPDWGTHHFVKLHDGTYADSLGLWSEDAFLSYWKAVDPTARITTFEAEPAPVEERNPKFKVSNSELFSAVNDLINQHIAGKTL